MNLERLFKIQKALDDKIMDKHPELKGQDNLDWKVLALQVELGECANEWRGFKKWSNDQKPRTKVLIECKDCGGSGRDYYGLCGNCHGGYVGEKNPLLEEYVDGLHFILSIGLYLEVRDYSFNTFKVKSNDVIKQFREIYYSSSHIESFGDVNEYKDLVEHFLGLGEMLGFTWEQIEQAYLDKNKVNHERQANGY